MEQIEYSNMPTAGDRAGGYLVVVDSTKTLFRPEELSEARRFYRENSKKARREAEFRTLSSFQYKAEQTLSRAAARNFFES